MLLGDLAMGIFLYLANCITSGKIAGFQITQQFCIVRVAQGADVRSKKQVLGVEKKPWFLNPQQ
jgi:hypothetical protein